MKVDLSAIKLNDPAGSPVNAKAPDSSVVTGGREAPGPVHWTLTWARPSAVAVCGSTTGAAAEPPQPVAARLIRCESAYRALALQFRSGQTAQAVSTLRGLDRDDLRKVVAQLKKREPSRFAWERAALVSAGLAHVEATTIADRARRLSDYSYHAELASS